MKFDLTKLTYAGLLVCFFVISAAWAIELCDDDFKIDEILVLLSLTTISMIAALNLGTSFEKLIRLPDDINIFKFPRKSILWLMIILDTIIFVASAFMLNVLTLFLMPLIFLILALYPITKYTTFMSHFFFGLSFAIVPIYVWAAIWRSFFSISREFALQPFILSFILMLWAATINIHDNMNVSNNVGFRHTIPQNLGKTVGKLMIKCNISVLLGLMFFLTVINGHTFIIWIGLAFTLVLLILSTQIINKDTDDESKKRFKLLNFASVIIYTFFLIIDVLVESYFVHG